MEAQESHISLCEALDRVLHKGVLLRGEVTISVANVDLIYLGFQALLASTETARRFIEGIPDSGPSLVSAPAIPHQEGVVDAG